MKALKTYGVTGLVEWSTIITAGKAHMRVLFTGGALTAYGTTPATFSTRNELVQKMIEDSKYFKEKRITLISEVREVEPSDIETKKVANKTAAADNLPDTEEQSVRRVEVTCLDDAKEFLRDQLGIRNIRTKADALKAVEGLGIEFVGL